jgi:lactoylglutathione lyase
LAAPEESLPILGIAEVEFKVSNLDSARGYYSGVLGYKEAADYKSAAGATVALFKVNDDQYIEITPTLQPGELHRLDHIGLETTDVQKAREMLVARGLNPTPIEKRNDGNLVFSVKDPDENTLTFVQYMSGSLQEKARGKYNLDSRVSVHIYHVGMRIKDRQVSMEFYRDKLGFDQGRNLPGGRGEYLEPSTNAVDLETKEPNLPDTPATHEQYEREQYGSSEHVCLEVPDIQAAKRLVQERGKFSDKRVAPHIGHNRHWLLNIFDPDGTRTEIMEPTLQPVPPATGPQP